MRLFLSTVIVTVLSASASVEAKTYPCGAATQNWSNGSKTACPYDSNGGGAAPTIVAPTIVTPTIVAPETPVQVINTDCAALSNNILPPVLRKRTVADFDDALALVSNGGCG